MNPAPNPPSNAHGEIPTSKNKFLAHPGADWTYRPTALRAMGPWLKFIMFSSAYLPSLEIIFESSQKDPYILDFL